MKKVLVLAGLDPTAGAGVVADILTINNLAAYPLPIITTLSAQNTQKVTTIISINNDIIKQQFDAIYADTSIDIIKIGLIDNNNKEAIKYIISKAKCRVVLDPVLTSSTNYNFNNMTIIKKLLKSVYLLTPNALELQRLSDEKDEKSSVKKLNLPYILITKTDSSDKTITHKLYKNSELIKTFNYKKLPHNYHGSGCVLSAALSVMLINHNTIDACKLAFDYTYQSLLNAKKIGKMQLSPNHQFNYVYK